MTRQALDLTINGESHQLMVEPHWSLLHVLRGELGMTGTKENCLEAECGVCTVLLDGKAVNSCILLAEQCRGRSIVTIEGLGDPEHLHPLQAAFIEHGAEAPDQPGRARARHDRRDADRACDRRHGDA